MKGTLVFAFAIFFGVIACKSRDFQDEERLYSYDRSEYKIDVSDEGEYLAVDRSNPSTEEYSCDMNVKNSCALIPKHDDDCFGCLHESGKGVMAVPVRKAIEHIKSKEGRCKKEFEQAFKEAEKSGKKPRLADDLSCLNFNWAECIKGTCQLVKLSEEALKKKMEWVQKMMKEEQEKRQRSNGN